MFHDVYARLHLTEEPDFIMFRELLYADDIVLMSRSRENLQKLLNEVVTEGSKYGLELKIGRNVFLKRSRRCRSVPSYVI